LPTWNDFPADAVDIFKKVRTPGVGEKMIFDENAFVEQLLPGTTVRKLTEAEMAVYRAPFSTRESRRPMWRFPNELPIEREPADVYSMVEEAHRALAQSSYPKLLFVGEPGGLVTPAFAESFANGLKNCKVVHIGPGIHYVEEDNPTTKGVEHVAPFVGLDATTSTVASNSGTIFSGLPSLYNHELPGVNANSVLADLRKRLSVIKDAFVLTIPPPPVQGLGNSGGFKMMLEDRDGLGPEPLVQAAKALVSAANKDPNFAGVFTLFNAGSPSIYADIDRVKTEKVGLTPTDVFSTLQVYLGSQYVNDFNYLGRTYQVIAQGDGRFRQKPEDIARLKARNASGQMVPIGTVARLVDATIPYRVPRYNLYPAAEVQGVAAPGIASGTALRRMEELAHQVLPKGISFEWTDLAYQQQERGTPTLLVFGAAALFVFLVLVAQYESWKLPLSIVLILPMCLLASVTGLLSRGMPIDILAQIGFVVLVGLAAKNAILIVEFARQKEEEDGVGAGEAAVHAARTRLRPILMTSFAFILGVAPLAVATGAGAEMRQSLGTAVLFGMIGVTCFGLLFTPAFYTFIRKLGRK
jgi:multidrug efflux pump